MYKNAELRMVLATVRSGTTAFIHALSQHSKICIATGLLKQGLREKGYLDYDLYNLISTKPFIVYKNSFGYKTLSECTYNPFPTDEFIESCRPLFIFRDPIHVMNSWRRMNWGNISLFESAYQHPIDLFNDANNKSKNAKCLCYELIANHPEKIFHKVLLNWDISYESNILNWKKKFGAGTINCFDKRLDERRNKLVQNLKRGIHDSLLFGKKTFYFRRNKIILSCKEVDKINNIFRETYEKLYEQSFKFFG